MTADEAKQPVSLKATSTHSQQVARTWQQCYNISLDCRGHALALATHVCPPDTVSLHGWLRLYGVMHNLPFLRMALRAQWVIVLSWKGEQGLHLFEV